MPQSFTATDTAVIQRAQRKRREVIVLREDSDWLSDFSSSPKDMLRRMANRGSLIPVGAGRYAIPIIGSNSPAYKAVQPLLHARLAPLGSYYLGGLSALAENHLTDLSERALFVVAGFWNSMLGNGKIVVAGRPVRAAITRRRVFTEDLGIETVRLSRTEAYRRSNPTRALVDCLWHPELCGTPEAWITAWGRGARSVLDPTSACRYAISLGPSAARRTGLMLDLLGHSDTAEAMLAYARRADRPTPLVARGSSVEKTAERDATWNVVFNVPRERVVGWLSYGK